jgi:hypothetical protein
MTRFSALQDHFVFVARQVLRGRVVPLLGAGVNLCGRPKDAVWRVTDRRFLPSGDELADFLAERSGYHRASEHETLMLSRIAQYAALMHGSGALYDELHDVFDADYEPTAVHELVAGLPAMLRRRRASPPYPLVVTTNYDDALECAFRTREPPEPFDLVSYVADGEHRGKFLHRSPDGQTKVIEKPNRYGGVDPDVQTVILKIHGDVDRLHSDWGDSYVITEDHYIDYLTRTEISALLPATLVARLRQSHFLFLGYSMADWNLRVIFHRIWGEQRLSRNSWAVLLEPDRLERKYWEARGVEILAIPLERYVARLKRELDRAVRAAVNV